MMADGTGEACSSDSLIMHSQCPHLQGSAAQVASHEALAQSKPVVGGKATESDKSGEKGQSFASKLEVRVCSAPHMAQWETPLQHTIDVSIQFGRGGPLCQHDWQWPDFVAA